MNMTWDTNYIAIVPYDGNEMYVEQHLYYGDLMYGVPLCASSFLGTRYERPSNVMKYLMDKYGDKIDCITGCTAKDDDDSGYKVYITFHLTEKIDMIKDYIDQIRGNDTVCSYVSVDELDGSSKYEACAEALYLLPT